MLPTCIAYLLQLAILSGLVISADVAYRRSRVEVTTAYRALDAVLHGSLTIGLNYASLSQKRSVIRL